MKYTTRKTERGTRYVDALKQGGLTLVESVDSYKAAEPDYDCEPEDQAVADRLRYLIIQVRRGNELP